MLSIRKLLYVLNTTALAAALGCGGGEPGAAPETAPEPTAAETPAPENLTEVDPAVAATITGKVMFEGDAPKPRRLNMGADEDCKTTQDGPIYSEQVVVNDNQTLKNVFVWVRNGLEGKQFATPSEKVVIDQHGCVYVPHVVGAMVGQTVSVTNSDPMLHNVHPLPRSNNEWNKSQASGASAIEETFSKPELMIPVKCNIHPWMRAYVNVSPHPFFAVTGDDGSFEIRGLPPGTYTIEVVQEKYGNQTLEVTVGDGETKDVTLTYAAE